MPRRVRQKQPKGEQMIRGLMILLENKSEINERSIKNNLGRSDFITRGWDIHQRGGVTNLKVRLISKLGTPEIEKIIKEAKKRLKERG